MLVNGLMVDKRQKILVLLHAWGKTPSHNFSHALRVARNATTIARTEGGNLSVLIPATLLHDTHRQKGISARKLLTHAGYKPSEAREILCTIKTHSYNARQPRTLEQKILYDADKIDALGATGIARFFMLCGEEKRNLENSLNLALKRIELTAKKDFQTKTGARMGEERAVVSLLFFGKLCRELDKPELLNRLRIALRKKGVKGELLSRVV